MEKDIKTVRRLRTPASSQWQYLLFWPIYGIRYVLIEQFHPAQQYHVIQCPLDQDIPFLEAFLIPYMLWHAALIAMHLYTLYFEPQIYRQYSLYLIISMSVSTIIFLLYPNCQNLRPEVYPRDNLLTRLVQVLHRADTSTNVFPSEHAIGSIAFWSAAFRIKPLRRPVPITLITLFCLLVCMSTVFLKQHSVLDLAAAVPICMITDKICYTRQKHPCSS